MGLLLNEFVDIKSFDILAESVGDGKPPVYKIKGPFIRAEITNANSRIYPREVLGESVNVYNEKMVSTRRALGQLEHVNVPSIQLDRVSHLVESLEMIDNDGIGVARLLDTPMGKIAQTLAKEQILFGVSSRGIGELGHDSRVRPGYEICAIDIVADPSAGTMVDAIMENKEWIQGPNGQWKAMERLEKRLERKLDPEQMSNLLNQFLIEVSMGKI